MDAGEYMLVRVRLSLNYQNEAANLAYMSGSHPLGYAVGDRPPSSAANN